MKVRRGNSGAVMSVCMSDDQPEDLTRFRQEIRQMEQMERLIDEVRSLRTMLMLPTIIIVLFAIWVVANS